MSRILPSLIGIKNGARLDEIVTLMRTIDKMIDKAKRKKKS